MPVYDFKCHECNEQFEHLALPPAKELLEVECPSCKSKSTEKLLSAPNVKFKGPGFYSTDSKSDSKKKENNSSAT